MGVCNTAETPKLVVHKASHQSMTKSKLVQPSSRPCQDKNLATATTASCAVKVSLKSINSSPTNTRRRKVHFGVSCSTSSCSSFDSSSESKANAEGRTQTELPLVTIVYQIPSNEGMDDHDRSQLWWTKEERRDILSRNRATIQDYIRRHPLHIQHLKQVFDKECCRVSVPTSTRSSSVLVSSEDDDNDISTSSSEDSDDGDSADVIDDFEQRRRQRRRVHRSFGLRALCSERPQKRHKKASILENNDVNLPICVRGLEYGILPDAKAHRKVHQQRILKWQERLRSTRQVQHRNHNEALLACSDVTYDQNDVLEQQSLISSHRSRRLAQLLAASDASTFDDNKAAGMTQLLYAMNQRGVGQSVPWRRISIMSSSDTAASGIYMPFMRSSRPRMMPI
ncbi:hypothetical protein IV203_004387 [Nitzschia inconspicua]|uniref:Uncharacterized protein n=1 Tax=Nitzschia inconspicua TaxID=303405 RepID=A0A9K3PQ31_9STRA|nr:hypothetical protein IV203_004387 [Nitzschia inconspicua]